MDAEIKNKTETKRKRIKVKKIKTNNEGYVTKVIISWGKAKIPFKRFKERPGRADLDNPDAPKVPAEIYAKMIRQASAILGQKRKVDKPIVLVREIQPEQIFDNKTRKWLYCLDAAGIKILENGRIQINYWVKRKNKPLKNDPRILSSIHAAIRQQKHILENYRKTISNKTGELNEIYSLEGLILHANRLLRNWSSLNYLEKEKTTAKLTTALSLLGRCRRESKVRIREKVIELIPLRDKLNRLNPGAMAAKTISALNLLAQRLNEIHAITPIIALRQELLVLENRRLWDNIQKCKKTLKFILKKHFPDDKIVIQTKKQRNFINILFGQALYQLNHVWCSPYFEQAIQIKNLIKMAKMANLRDNPPQTTKHIKVAIYAAEYILKKNPLA